MLSTSGTQTSVGKIVQDSCIAPEDVVTALKEMALVEPEKNATGEVVLVRGKVKAWADLHSILMVSPVDKTAFTEALEEPYRGNEAKR